MNVLYHDGAGRIVQTCSSDRADFDPAIPGLAWLEGEADPHAEYVLDGAVVPRPALAGFDRLEIAANGADVATLAGLPQPCTVTVNGVAEVVPDGIYELGSALPGTFLVEVDHFPYLRLAQTVVAI